MKKLAKFINYPRWIHSIFKVRYKRKPLKKFEARTLFPWFVAHRDRYIEWELKNHEIIHQYQMLDFVLVAALLLIFSTWWLALIALFGQGIIHLINYLFLLFTKKEIQYAYRNTAFEREAYSNEGNKNYLTNRMPFAWIKYLLKK